MLVTATEFTCLNSTMPDVPPLRVGMFIVSDPETLHEIKALIHRRAEQLNANTVTIQPEPLVSLQ
jgi:hypothetical protein